MPHVFRHAPGAFKFWSKNHQHHQHPWCNDLIPNSLLLKHHLAQKKRPTGKNVATSAAKHSKTHKFRYPQTSPDQQIPESKPFKTHQMAWPVETPRCAACKVSANRTSRPFRVVMGRHMIPLSLSPSTDNTLSSISPLCFLLWNSKVTSQAFPNLTCLVVCQYPVPLVAFQGWHVQFSKCEMSTSTPKKCGNNSPTHKVVVTTPSAICQHLTEFWSQMPSLQKMVW